MVTSSWELATSPSALYEASRTYLRNPKTFWISAGSQQTCWINQSSFVHKKKASDKSFILFGLEVSKFSLTTVEEGWAQVRRQLTVVTELLSPQFAVIHALFLRESGGGGVIRKLIVGGSA